MPKVKHYVDKLKHPNSRKTLSVAKKILKGEKRDQKKLGTDIKNNLVGEKLMWFKDRIPDECSILSKEQTLDLVETYFARFDEELEQINLKNSIGQRKNRQHSSREDIINMTKKKEQEEFATCGLEMPDLMDKHQIDILRNWNGELRFLQHFKLKRIAKSHLT
jgi:translation machinery-associated protein 16